MSKLYTEEQVIAVFTVFGGLTKDTAKKAIELAIHIELPSDEEIKEESDCFYSLESYNQAFIRGAKWMRDTIKGGSNE